MDIVWLVGLLTPYLPFLMGLGGYQLKAGHLMG